MAVSNLAALAAAKADVGKRYPQGWCLQKVRTWLGIPALPQDGWDHDGRNEAMDAWVGAKFKHAGDRNPPAGRPVFFTGGPSGHVALAQGNGERVYSTDWPVGFVGETTISAIERAWGRRYVGWSDDLNGVVIPIEVAKPVVPPPPPVPVVTPVLPAPAPISAITSEEDDMLATAKILYSDVLGRAGSFDEWNGWAASAANEKALIASFLAAPAEEGTVVKAFRDYFGTDPDPAGLTYWKSLGLSIGELRKRIQFEASKR